MMILLIIASLCCYLLFSFKKDNRTQKEKAQSFRSLKSFVCAATTTENAVTH